MRQGQLDSLADLLLLHVQAADVGIRDVGLLVGAQHGNGGVGLGRENVNEGIGVSVEGDRGGGLELLAIEGRENPDDVIRASAGLNDTGAVVV
jgi:hypothetical protein